MQYEKLLSPGKINNLELRNRIIMPPMGTAMNDTTGTPNEKLIELFARRARGGAGMLITEPIFSEIPDEDLKDIFAGILSPHSDITNPTLYDWVEVVQSYGAKMCAALSPVPTRWLLKQMKKTAMRMDELEGEIYSGLAVFNLLSTEAIDSILDQFVRGSVSLKAFGFDAIEINFTMLCDYFTLEHMNLREDKYRFESENGMVFVREMIQQTRKALGPDYPLMLMLDADQYTPGWRTIEDTKIMARQFEDWGIDSIRCRAGTSIQMQYDCIPHYLPKGALVHLAEAVKQVVSIPVIANGRLNDPDIAEAVLQNNQADFISIARGLLADPDLPNKLKTGKLDRVRKCLSCNIGCMSNLMVHPTRPFRCTVNPLLGNEEKFRGITPATHKKKVVVVGGGPGGMSAALTAAQRGHQVVLFEKTGKIGGGGYFDISCIPPFKQENRYLVEYYEREFQEYPNLEIALNTTADAHKISTLNPDAVIIATGAHWEMPGFCNHDRGDVLSFEDVLLEKKEVGENIIIVGGGSTGCETAHFLLVKGKKVTIIDMLPRMAHEVVHPNRNCLMEELTKYGAVMVTGAKVMSVTCDSVSYHKDDEGHQIKGDTVVIATGVKGGSEIYDNMMSYPVEVCLIGDAKEPRQFIDAVREGFYTAYGL